MQTWQSPALKLAVAFAASLALIFAVHRCTSGAREWERVPSGTTADLLAVWGSSPNDVWAVGAAGTIVHFDGVKWGVVTSADVTADMRLESVWGSGPNEVWATGPQGTVLFYDGARWAKRSPAGKAVAIGGTSIKDVWAIGEGIDHFDGNTWTRTEGRGNARARGVWASGPDDAWVAGGDRVAHWDGKRWSTVPTVLTGDARVEAISGVSSKEAWAVGTYGTVLKWDGWGFGLVRKGDEHLVAIHARSAVDVWAAGRLFDDPARGIVLHFDGARWEGELLGDVGLSAIWSTGSHVWAVGNGGTILRRNGH